MHVAQSSNGLHRCDGRHCLPWTGTHLMRKQRRSRNLVIVSQMISGAAQFQVHRIGNFGVAINLIAAHMVCIEVDAMFGNKRMKLQVPLHPTVNVN